MKYFEFYDISVSFTPDQGLIKKKYYQKSKEFHPDFYVTESEEKQKEILELSSFNTMAFDTLSNDRKRIAYILEQTGMIDKEKKEPSMPQDFLMEMMEINEQLMELEFDFDPKSFQKVLTIIEEKEMEMENNIQPYLEKWSLDDADSSKTLENIKDYFYKKKYLLRIKEKLNKFATQS